MPLYEHVYLARQDISAQQVETLTDHFKSVIAENGGTVGKAEYWGLKSLTFRIKKNRKAHYTLFNVDAPSSALAEMERQMRLNEDVLRYMTIRVDALDDTPSIMMQKRDERRGERAERSNRQGQFRDGHSSYNARSDNASEKEEAN